MDLKSFYKKIDVDSIKNKIPPLKIPKIKSRKIFKSSREDLAQQQSPAVDAMGSVGSPITPQSLPGRSSFIDRTPTRISTVSSLMNINYGFKDKHDSGQSTYRTANNFEEENCPDEVDMREPVTGNSIGKFGDKCKKTYKDFSEFKIKNIFAKKTVVKKTEIEVDIYARQYERDNYLEERYLDHQLEQGYEFEFKEARRRLSMSSGSISPPDSVTSGVPSPLRSDLSHLQRNNTPPLLAKRRNAITHAELSRQKYHQRSVSSESNDEPPRKPKRSNLWGLHESTEDDSSETKVQVQRTKKSMKEDMKKSISEADLGNDDQPKPGISRLDRIKKQTRRALSHDSNHAAELTEENPPESKAGLSRMARFKKSMKDGLAEGFSDKHAQAESRDDHQPSGALKSDTSSRLARFKKSMKDGIAEGFSDKQHVSAESGDEQSTANKTSTSRMARFKKSMKEQISEAISERNNATESADEQSQNQKGTSRIARLKKTFKDGISDKNATDESGQDQTSSNKTSTSRISKFKASMREGISDKNIPPESGDEQPKASESRMSKFKKSMKDGITHEFDTSWNLKGIRNKFTQEDNATDQRSKRNIQSQESLDVQSQSDAEKKSWKFSNIHLRRAESSDMNNEPPISSPEGKFSSIKTSLNRLKNRKPQRQTSEESETEQHVDSPRQNMSDQLKAGLRRLKMRERTLTFDEDESKAPKESSTSRLQNWKKSMKIKQQTELASDDNNTEAPPLPASSPPRRSLTLIKKLNHIRSRKGFSEDEADSADPSQSNDQQNKQKSSNLEKFDQARTKTMKKFNAQMQKMKNFHGKSRDSPTEGSPDKPKRKTEPKPLATIPSSHSLESQLSLDDTQDNPQVSNKNTLRKSVKCEQMSKEVILKKSTLASQHSLESSLSFEDDNAEEEDNDVANVFLHQDNSDNNYESTLTVAVTRRAPLPPSSATKESILKTTKYQTPKTEWIPNKSAISNFLEMTPSPESSTQQLDASSRGHLRKRSMDSNDSDSWIPDNFRNKSCSSSTIAGLNKISENSEPWKVHSVFNEEKLYKTKSIDIFSNRDGGAFKDFDDEMKNVPIRRIVADSAESLNRSCAADSTDDDDDYDNSSRVTKLKYESSMVSTKAAIETGRSDNLQESVKDLNKATRLSPVPNKKEAQIGNSQESLDANYDENEELSSGIEDDDDDEAPTMAPSPPPSFSPPPPPLPLRKPPRLVPERNDSMVRLTHPLVKQGSLRRHFSEEIEPSDLGKVNKLITRFEKNPTYENVPRIQLIPSDDDDILINMVEEPKDIKAKENGARKRSVQYPQHIFAEDVLQKEEKHETHLMDNASTKKNQTRSEPSDEECNSEQKKLAGTTSKRRPAPIPNLIVDDSKNNNNDNKHKKDVNHNKNHENNNTRTKQTQQDQQRGAPSPQLLENLDNVSIQSPNSVYGSPIGSISLSTSSVYGSPIGAAYPSKTSEHYMRSNRRLSNRSSVRDDDTFYSFESDEENNFYSLGDSSDMRYTIEI